MYQLPETGLVARHELARALMVDVRTLDVWSLKGRKGLKLPRHLIGVRWHYEWEEYHAWQRAVERKMPDVPNIGSLKQRRRNKRELDRMGV